MVDVLDTLRLKTIFIPIESWSLWMIILFIAGITLVVGAILEHHWVYYGITNTKKIYARQIFWIVNIILFVLLILLNSWYSIS